MQPENIQHQPIQQLAFSESFKAMAKTQNIQTLSNLLELKPEQILSINGLTFTHLQEYRAFCQDHQLEYLQKK